MVSQGLTLDALFKEFDTDRSGSLQQLEVLRMVVTLVPDASDFDMRHFRVSGFCAGRWGDACIICCCLMSAQARNILVCVSCIHYVQVNMWTIVTGK